jgi:hypothetical protein
MLGAIGTFVRFKVRRRRPRAGGSGLAVGDLMHAARSRRQRAAIRMAAECRPPILLGSLLSRDLHNALLEA